MKVRFAVSPGGSSFDPGRLVEFATRSEAEGFDTIWLSDIPMGALGDPLVTLAHVAAVTTRLRLGANVVPIGRNPMLLARQLAQIDQLSGGRLLLTFVPGVDQPGERTALGFPTTNRGELVEEIMDLLRRWWAGETVDHHSDHFAFDAVTVLPRPHQDPLEIWLGGKGPIALERVGRAGDGWLTAAVTPDEAGRGKETILAGAAAHGRTIDTEHFGISIPYARKELPAATIAAMQQRRGTSTADIREIAPVGADALNSLLQRHIDNGLSKFVLRPVDGEGPAVDLPWLADVVLPLQN